MPVASVKLVLSSTLKFGLFAGAGYLINEMDIVKN